MKIPKMSRVDAEVLIGLFFILMVVGTVLSVAWWSLIGFVFAFILFILFGIFVLMVTIIFNYLERLQPVQSLMDFWNTKIATKDDESDS